MLQGTIILDVTIQVDMARFPVVIVRWQGTNTDAQMLGYLSTMTTIVQRPELKVIVYDATSAQIPPPSQRRLQGEWMVAHQSSMTRWGVGTAFVFSSAVMRGALTAVLWLAPIPNGHFVTSTIEEALSWGEARLREARLARAAQP